MELDFRNKEKNGGWKITCPECKNISYVDNKAHRPVSCPYCGQEHPLTIEKVPENEGAAIEDFRGEYAFLSNFYETPVNYEGMTYGSAEAAFQAAKCATVVERSQFLNLSPSEAKHLGRRVNLRPDWEDVKVKIMFRIVFNKFADNAFLTKKLLETGKVKLVEGNTWGDTFWGMDRGTRRGENKLGMILMDIREFLRKMN